MELYYQASGGERLIIVFLTAFQRTFKHLFLVFDNIGLHFKERKERKEREEREEREERKEDENNMDQFLIKPMTFQL